MKNEKITIAVVAVAVFLSGLVVGWVVRAKTMHAPFINVGRGGAVYDTRTGQAWYITYDGKRLLEDKSKIAALRSEQ